MNLEDKVNKRRGLTHPFENGDSLDICATPEAAQALEQVGGHAHWPPHYGGWFGKDRPFYG